MGTDWFVGFGRGGVSHAEWNLVKEAFLSLVPEARMVKLFPHFGRCNPFEVSRWRHD